MASATHAEPTADPASLRLSSDPKEALLELVSQRKQPLAARLRDCRALRFENGALEVVIARGDAWLREALDRPQNREILDGAVRQVWGTAGRWHIVEETSTAPAVAPVVVTQAPMLDHPLVQSALDLFAGTIGTIEESPPPEEP
ncbi:MAG TPA: hypothetical protein VHR17_08430 [Thermoanaerobaculia bacterium]|nr:hypothetical protein [Thermoanaerobaculia bacterium]